MFTALASANVNWDVVAGAAATFIVTAIVTALGFKKGLRKIKETPAAVTPIMGASIMDNMSILMLTEALKENSELLRQLHPCLTELKLIGQMSLNNRH